MFWTFFILVINIFFKTSRDILMIFEREIMLASLLYHNGIRGSFILFEHSSQSNESMLTGNK
ncbi:hypothetical protein ACJX0J_025982, partial [Zea mays]